MGTTITSLHMYGIERDALASFLAKDDVLQNVNPPWLSIVPSNDTDRRDPSRMERLAKKVTKPHENAYALLFFYFDEDVFICKLFKAGKCVAGCRSSQSWAKLGKALNMLFDDESPAKALRYAPHCFSLDEQVRLLEETLGVALLDYPEEAPRVVPRSDALVSAIKAREAALRKRPNQCTLTEVPFAKWPEPFQSKQRLYNILRPRWQQVHVSDLLGNIATDKYIVPHESQIVAFPYVDPAHESRLLLFNGCTGQLSELFFPGVSLCRVLFITKAGGIVCQISRILQERSGATGWSRMYGKPYVACVNSNGQELWRFEGKTEDQHLEYVHTSADGTITLYSGYHSTYHGGKTDHFDGYVYQIDGETGDLLRSRQIPASEDKMIHLMRVDAVDGFIYSAMDTGDLVVLDVTLHEVARWHGYPYQPYIDHAICGSRICAAKIPGEFIILDLRNGKISSVHPEVPAYPIAVLSDGRILGLNDKENRLTVFDDDGSVISRHTVPGTLRLFTSEDKSRVLLSEWRSTEDITFYCEESLDASSMHVWELRNI